MSVKRKIPQAVEITRKTSFSDYLLSDVAPIVSELSVGFSTSFLCTSSTYSVPKSPLRLIVSRFPAFLELYNDGTDQFGWYLDTLNCTHQQIVFERDSDAKRHRCPECGQAQVSALPPKKPAASAPIPKVNRRAA